MTTHSHFDHAGGNEKCVQQCVQFPLFVEGFESGGFPKERRRSERPVSARPDILTEFYRRYPGIKVYGGGDKVARLTDLVRFLLASVSGQGTTENEVGSSRSRAGTGQRQRYLQDWISRRQGRVHSVPVSLLAPAASEENCRLTRLGHHSTQDHICYFVEDKQKNQRAVFTGCAADRSKICLASPTDTEGHTAETLCSSAVAVAFSKASRGRCTSL